MTNSMVHIHIAGLFVKNMHHVSVQFFAWFASLISTRRHIFIRKTKGKQMVKRALQYMDLYALLQPTSSLCHQPDHVTGWACTYVYQTFLFTRVMKKKK